MTDAANHLYVHVPFCDGKCGYCGFYSERYTPERAERFLKAIEEEIRRALPGTSEPETIYFGGGTPSILSDTELAALCSAILNRISTRRLQEWTVEANPGTLPPSKLHILKDAGVNRVSLGAQSFDDETLRRIGRRHNADAIARTVSEIRSAGITNIGLDLIASLPGVSLDGWKASLHAAATLEPTHVSVYSLSIEAGSRFESLVQSGELALPGEDGELAALDTAEEILGTAGFNRYEISNYARPGFECRHNVAFWRGGDYLGVGPAAASRRGLERWTNNPDLDAYLAETRGNEWPPRATETLAPEVDKAERFVFSLRLAEGSDPSRLAGVSPAELARWQTTLASLSKQGFTEQCGPSWRLTRRGREVADFVAGELMP